MTTPSWLPRSALYRAEAIVLRHQDLGETDRLVVLYSREHGKIRASVRGARKVLSRLGGHLEPLTRARLLLVRGQNLDIIAQAEGIELFPRIRRNLLLTTQGLYLAELAGLFTEEPEAQPALYDLLLEGLRLLEAGEPGDLVLRRYDMQLLALQGYRPSLDACASCGRPVPADGPGSFSPSWGGLLCERCSPQEQTARRVSTAALMGLRLLQKGEWQALHHKWPARDVAWEMEQVLRWYIQSVVERPLQTAAFLDRLRSGKG